MIETIIRPSRGWPRVDLKSLWEYRDLLYLLVRRDFVARYKQTILGPLWFVIQPVLTTLIFTVVFTNVAQIPTHGLPPVLFYLCGLLAWNYFAQNFTTISTTFVNNAQLLGKVYFPRLVIPLSAILSNLFAFAIQAATFIAFYFYYKLCTSAGPRFGANWHLIFVPALTLQVALLSLGVGLWMSALTAKYRDLTHVVALLVQLWMYATPVIYPLSQIPEKWRWLVMLNPMTFPVEAFRLALLGKGDFSPALALLSLALTGLLLVSGILIFNKVERTFVDTV